MTSYVRMAEPIYSKIEAKILETYKNACIVWIEKVENKELEESYILYKASFDAPNEKMLFHGTSESVARKIVREGFDPKFNTASAYGKGVYFSLLASYSKEYCLMKEARMRKDDLAYLLVCDVITGRVGQGSSGLRIPYQYDSLTDNLRQPTMYVVDKKGSCIPRFIVAFHPNAK